jgi:hypothetical protein
LFPFILRNWNLTNVIGYFFRMWHSTTFQSYHISLSQIHGVRDENWLYRFTCYFSNAQLIAVMVARSVRDWRGGIDGQECRPGASAHDRARRGFLPSNSCLLYFLSIDYINRPVGCPYLARDSYLLKTLNKLLTDNLPR